MNINRKYDECMMPSVWWEWCLRKPWLVFFVILLLIVLILLLIAIKIKIIFMVLW